MAHIIVLVLPHKYLAYRAAILRDSINSLRVSVCEQMDSYRIITIIGQRARALGA